MEIEFWWALVGVNNFVSGLALGWMFCDTHIRSKYK